MEIWEEISADAHSGAARLVAEYGDRLFTAASHIVQNETDAEDLVLRTFERVLDKIELFDGRSKFFSWLYSIMLNFRLMDLRRKGSNALVFNENVPDVEDLSLDPAEVLALKSDASAVRAAVASLEEPLRTVVVLHYFEDFDIKAIAELTSVPIGTAKFRLYRARKLLAAMLSQTYRADSSSYGAEKPK